MTIGNGVRLQAYPGSRDGSYGETMRGRNRSESYLLTWGWTPGLGGGYFDAQGVLIHVRVDPTMPPASWEWSRSEIRGWRLIRPGNLPNLL